VENKLKYCFRFGWELRCDCRKWKLRCHQSELLYLLSVTLLLMNSI
jgi:hypothetical protein